MSTTPIDDWHRVVRERDAAGLDALLADFVVFHSPVMYTPQTGRTRTRTYLIAAMQVLGNETFHYVREFVGERDAVLEFVCEVDGVQVNGVDLIAWNEEGRISEFKVMLRPLKAVHVVQQHMADLLRSAVPIVDFEDTDD